MRILITNDDGANAPQLVPLIKWCQGLGEVTTVVPKFEQSGKSHCIELHQSFEVLQVELASGVPAYTVDSSPADCVRYAVLGLNLQFDLVISGVNRGFNLGTDIMYSGTVGACFEAANLDVPAIALSTSPGNYDHATDNLTEIFDFIREHKLMELHSLYNVNIPPQSKGIRVTRQGGPFYSDEFVPEENNMFRPKGIKIYEYRDDMTIDADAVTAGYISIMPLTTDRAEMTVYNKIKELRR